GGRQIAFDVWSPRHFGGGVIVALINGPLVRAARVDGANQPLALRLAGAAALAGSHNIASWGGTAQFAANFTIDGAV
ncbi:hypothetical protein, partial [Escherichia coli]|nr:hypothetical protein [Escherichia coli]